MRVWFWQFITGYVKIKIEGLKLLHFVNDAAAQGILLQCTVRDAYSRITAMVTWRDYRRLLMLARNKPLRIVALSQGGLPYIASLAMKRAVFTAGLVLCIAALIAVNFFVLDVRVTGCTKPGLEARVLAIASLQGLKPGAVKSTMDLHECEKALMLGLQEISFAAIRVNGVVATVTVVEGVPVPELLDKSTPCDIVAGHDGIVRKVLVFDGDAKVLAGDAVRQGQVLVDGTVILAEGVKRIHARAEVMASIWYEGQGSAPLFKTQSLRTGAVVERQRLEFAGYVLPVGEQGKPDFGQYDEEVTSAFLLGEKGPKLVTTRYFEAYRVSEHQDFEKARETALLQAVGMTDALVPKDVKVVGSRTDYSYEDGNIIAKVYIETLENIAVEKKIN